MKNKRGALFIITGLVMMALSFVLTGFNFYESYVAGQSVKTVSGQIVYNEPRTEDIPLYIFHPEIEMPTETIEGNDYIGMLEIPALGLELPVISQWSDPALKIAPCRYIGSVYMNNMIIAAHDYRYHFGKLKKLAVDEQVIFTDMDGNKFYYTVSFKEVLSPNAVEEMMAGDWDLTMFTCTPDAANRLAVRCQRVH